MFTMEYFISSSFKNGTSLRGRGFSDWTLKNADDATDSSLIGLTSKKISAIFCHLAMETHKPHPEKVVVIDFTPLIPSH